MENTTATQTRESGREEGHMAFTQIAASELPVGSKVRLGETFRHAVAVSAPRRGQVTILLDGIGDWKVAEDFPVTVVARQRCTVYK